MHSVYLVAKSRVVASIIIIIIIDVCCISRYACSNKQKKEDHTITIYLCATEHTLHEC